MLHYQLTLPHSWACIYVFTPLLRPDQGRTDTSGNKISLFSRQSFKFWPIGLCWVEFIVGSVDVVIMTTFRNLSRSQILILTTVRPQYPQSHNHIFSFHWVKSIEKLKSTYLIRGIQKWRNSILAFFWALQKVLAMNLVRKKIISQIRLH